MRLPPSASPKPELSGCLGRHYRVPGAGRWFGRGFILFAGLVGALILLGKHSDISSVAIGMAARACLAAITVWWSGCGLGLGSNSINHWESGAHKASAAIRNSPRPPPRSRSGDTAAATNTDVVSDGLTTG
jgi:hypothetical protein